jgi:hypothetical protein
VWARLISDTRRKKKRLLQLIRPGPTWAARKLPGRPNREKNSEGGSWAVGRRLPSLSGKQVSFSSFFLFVFQNLFQIEIF